MEEEWKVIPEFPDFAVSSMGRVRSVITGREYKTSPNNWGNIRISFGQGENRQTRSVAKLVAKAFVEPMDEMCDAIIFYDGNLEHVRADNLAWRPRVFAWYYMHQFRVTQPVHYYNLPIDNADTRMEYDSVHDAGTSEGVLFFDIWESTWTGRRPYPHHHRYKVSERAFEQDFSMVEEFSGVNSLSMR